MACDLNLWFPEFLHLFFYASDVPLPGLSVSSSLVSIYHLIDSSMGWVFVGLLKLKEGGNWRDGSVQLVRHNLWPSCQLFLSLFFFPVLSWSIKQILASCRTVFFTSRSLGGFFFFCRNSEDVLPKENSGEWRALHLAASWLSSHLTMWLAPDEGHLALFTGSKKTWDGFRLYFVLVSIATVSQWNTAVGWSQELLVQKSRRCFRCGSRCPSGPCMDLAGK